jgi:endoglucanase
VLLLAGVLPVTAGEKQAVDPFIQNQKLGRGVNIIGYDPLWKSRDEARFKAGYFRMIKDAGFSNVRINLHPFRGMGRSDDNALPALWWETLDWATTNALESGLMVILDLHEFGAMGTDPEANKPKFLAFWRQVSERFRDAPDTVLFEILNEPSRELTAEMWNQYLGEALAIIRKTNPTRTVIIGPAGWNGIGELGGLKLPEDDRNIIVTVHYYSPMDFTH